MTTTHSDRTNSGIGFLVEVLRARPWARRAVSVASVMLLVIGVVMLGYPFFTNLQADRTQARLDRQLASPKLRQAYRERRVQPGDSLTRIKIPALGVDVVVVEGTTASALSAGSGHYPQTPLPCEAGNVAIAGCVYQVSRPPFVVRPDDLSVIAPTADRELTLTACHPKGSASQRIIVRATWVRDLQAT